MKKVILTSLLQLIFISSLLASQPVTSATKGVTVPVQPPSLRVLRALGFYTIFSVKKRTIYFDAGKNENLSKGEKVKIYRQIITRNPINGKLYRRKKIIGEARVISVDDEFSVAKIKWKYTKIRIGDLVKAVIPTRKELPFYQGHQIKFSSSFSNIKRLSNYWWNSLTFRYGAGLFKIGIGMDYIRTRAAGGGRGEIYLSRYDFEVVSDNLGIEITPVFGIASNDVTWGGSINLYFGNLYGTHLLVGYYSMLNIGYRGRIEGAFNLSPHFNVVSRTSIETFPDNSQNKKLVSTLNFSFLFKPIILTAGAGFGGISTNQAGPYFSAEIFYLITPE